MRIRITELKVSAEKACHPNYITANSAQDTPEYLQGMYDIYLNIRTKCTQLAANNIITQNVSDKICQDAQENIFRFMHYHVGKNTLFTVEHGTSNESTQEV